MTPTVCLAYVVSAHHQIAPIRISRNSTFSGQSCEIAGHCCTSLRPGFHRSLPGVAFPSVPCSTSKVAGGVSTFSHPSSNAADVASAQGDSSSIALASSELREDSRDDFVDHRDPREARDSRAGLAVEARPELRGGAAAAPSSVLVRMYVRDSDSIVQYHVWRISRGALQGKRRAGPSARLRGSSHGFTPTTAPGPWGSVARQRWLTWGSASRSIAVVGRRVGCKAEPRALRPARRVGGRPWAAGGAVGQRLMPSRKDAAAHDQALTWT